jgi:murein DD-endopeptidase MepM/ murein hydrolase activator NlpD
MTRQTARRPAGSLAAAAIALGLAACTGTQPRDAAEVEIRGTDPSGATARTAASGPARISGESIVQYDGYQAARAREGDTVSSLAARIGLSASELGAYNGLSPTHELRAGDELVLPPRPGGYEVASASPAPASPASAPAPSASEPGIEDLPLDDAAAPTGERTARAAGEAPAAASAPDAAPLPSESGWSPELAADAIARSAGESAGTGEAAVPGERVAVEAPPSSGAPLPQDPPPVRDLDSPELSQYQRAAAPETDTGERVAVAAPSSAGDEPDAVESRLQRPVEGPVALAFREGAGGARNDGVDFAAPEGAPVVAAADGEVALVSEALGGLGTIVLIRHPEGLLTVYGRISGVTVEKGDAVRRGQQIGVVAAPEGGIEPRMHFEVREGANSVDPMQYL